MAAGAYSSIFIATPLLVQLKSGETRGQAAREAAGQGPRAPRGRPLRRRCRRSPRTCRSRPSPATADDDRTTSSTTTADAVRRAGAPQRPAPTGRGRVAPPGAAARCSRAASAGRAAADPPAAVQARQEVSRSADGTAPSGADAPGRRRPGLPRARGRLQGHHARCSPTTTAFTAVVDALAAAGRDESGGRRRRQGRRHGGARLHPRRPGGAGARRRLRAGPQGRQAAARRRTRVSYALEYGEATLEVHRDAHRAGRAGAARRRRARHRRHRARRRVQLVERCGGVGRTASRC